MGQLTDPPAAEVIEVTCNHAPVEYADDIEVECSEEFLRKFMSIGRPTSSMVMVQLAGNRLAVRASKENPIFVDGFGIVHRKRRDCLFPMILDAERMEHFCSEWECGPSDSFIAIGPGFPPLTGELVLVVAALASGSPVDGVMMPPMPIELQVSQGVRLGGLMAQEGPAGRCFVTRSPPWLLPPALTGMGATGGPRNKVVVFCADPRFMMLSQQSAWKSMPLVPSQGLRHLDEVGFVEEALHNRNEWGGGAFESTAAWARIAATDPDRVYLLFMEDFLADPAASTRSLAQFLNIDPSSDAVDQAVQRLKKAWECGTVVQASVCGFPAVGAACDKPADWQAGEPGTDLAMLKARTNAFERLWATLPSRSKALWQDRIRTWSSLPNTRLCALAHLLSEHEVWEPPHWWSAHLAKFCRPCVFFLESRCQHGNGCGFCHAPSHARAKRPSKKERERRDKKRLSLRCRTPSPDGLSS